MGGRRARPCEQSEESTPPVMWLGALMGCYLEHSPAGRFVGSSQFKVPLAGSRFQYSRVQHSLHPKDGYKMFLAHPLGLEIEADTQPRVPQLFMEVLVSPEMTD